MGPEYVYAFDYKNNYDKLVFQDIPRPEVRYTVEGEIRDAGQARVWDDPNITIAVLKERGLSYRQIAEHVSINHTSVYQRAKRLRSHPALRELMM